MNPLLESLHDRATVSARNHDRGPAFEHLFLVLLREPIVRDLLGNAGLADLDGYERDLEYMIRYAPAYREDRLVKLLVAVEQLFAKLERELAIESLFAFLVRQHASPPMAALASRGVEAVHVLQAIAHGKRLSVERPRPSLVDRATGGRTGQYRVVLHDDPVTTLQFVLAVLMRELELPQAQALAEAKRIQAEHRVAFGPYPWRKALKILDAIEASARTECQPLRVTCEAGPS